MILKKKLIIMLRIILNAKYYSEIQKINAIKVNIINKNN